MLGNSTRAIVLACAGPLLLGCTEPVADPVTPGDPRPVLARKPGEPGAAPDRMLYQARLGALGDSRSHGVMLIEIVGGQLAVTVHAAGLPASRHVPQHIHVNPTCTPGGGVLVNLDAGLTVAGEGPGVGTAYPMSNHAGVVNYYASRPLVDLLAAVNAHAGAGLTSVADLLDWLDLDARNAHMHVAHGPPFPAVNCGEVERIN